MTGYREIAGVLLLAGVAAVSGCGQQTTPQPQQTAAPAPAPSQTTATLGSGEVALDFPADEAQVKQCEIFRGRADLPAGKTIVLGVRNEDNGSPERYFATVTDWEYPKDLGTWTGAQWFGSKDTAAGQRFRVEVLVVDLALATQMTKKSKADGWHSPDNPTGATVAAHIDLHRVKGKGPAECS